MTLFIVGFVAGFFVGVLVMALSLAAKREDESIEKEYYRKD